MGAPAPLEALEIDLLSAARWHSVLARLTTLRALKLRMRHCAQPPGAADAAALLAALAGLKGVVVTLRELWSIGEPLRFRPSDPLQLAGLAVLFVEYHPELSSMQLPAAKA